MRARRGGFLLVAVVGAAGALSLGSTALADTYSVGGPYGPYLLSVGTFGSDADFSVVGVSQGGCVRGSSIAVAAGPSPSGCTEASGQTVGVGLVGADSGGFLAVSDTGNATAPDCGIYLLGCFYVGEAVSGSGAATGHDVAVSGTGPASAAAVAVSGAGDANANGFTTYESDGYYPGLVAVSGTGDALAEDGVAVSVVGDAEGGVAGVSVLGDSGLAP